MADKLPAYRPGEFARDVEKARKQFEKAERLAHEMLQRPVPDTFLGRKTHEPFPVEEE
ncbi:MULTISPECIES: hypothetical protein [unclassified Bradyrhizobium]|uniref:hypothetical protein n=1 Tax=unclassified Bradyrhizobium TaxID=2631580 RepID=UPI0020B41851|nr:MULTISPECIES: hypothetical protein [unclassified Bradyrhizobium]MCP3402017.1 hypothetical protein [Bradyrhizobium sp. CCGB20]MCP3410503.1 hypothetical protein [Bradyrhizobium sp. CCGB01]